MKNKNEIRRKIEDIKAEIDSLRSSYYYNKIAIDNYDSGYEIAESDNDDIRYLNGQLEALLWVLNEPQNEYDPEERYIKLLREYEL